MSITSQHLVNTACEKPLRVKHRAVDYQVNVLSTGLVLTAPPPLGGSTVNGKQQKFYPPVGSF